LEAKVNLISEGNCYHLPGSGVTKESKDCHFEYRSTIRFQKMEGRVTLVFTDVVGSSAAKRAVELGDEASTRDRAYLANIQAAYLKVVRTCTAAHGGREIMTIGDSFFLAFSDTADAIHAAAAIQNELRDKPIQMWNGRLHLRVGIHVGCPEYFENSWHGTDVDIAARTEAAASADQIAITEAAQDAGSELGNYRVRRLGTFALKGVGNVRLFDVDYDGFGLRWPQLLSNEQKQRRRAAAASFLLLFLCAMIGVGIWQWRLRQEAAVLAAATKSSILISGFQNTTGDPIFDGVLSDGLTSQLEQSPVMNLVSEQRLSQDAGYLRRPVSAHLSEADIRELSVREGIKASISGSIRKLGSAYVVSVTARAIASGDTLVTEEAEAADKEHVMDALSRVAARVRRKLGESVDSIRKLDTPLGQATTSSLPAFEAFALGDAEHEKDHDVPEAEGYYRQAVEIEPGFAMAWARLGVVCVGDGRDSEGNQYLTKAYNLSKGISERERLYISGLYYDEAMGDLPKTISTLELATHVYPKESSNYINLGRAYDEYGEMDKGLSEFEQAAKLDSHSAIAMYNTLGMQLALDRIVDAEKTLASIKDHGMTSQSIYFLRILLLMSLLQGNQPAIEEIIKKADERPDQFAMLDSVARIQEFRGRYTEAHETWRIAGTQAKAARADDVEAFALLTSTASDALLGRCDGSAGKIEKALKMDRGKSTMREASYTAALCNQQSLTMSLDTRLAAAYPSDTLVNAVTIPQNKAVIALSNHRPAEALQYLAGSGAFDTVSPAAYLRGLAYLQLQDAAGAIDAFRRAVRYKGAALICCQDYTLSELGLARAYRMAGDSVRAKASYQSLLAIWSTADPKLPQLGEAKNELTSLQ
jgi:eukaryotic-like serine/threonine-protein kinase